MTSPGGEILALLQGKPARTSSSRKKRPATQSEVIQLSSGTSARKPTRRAYKGAGGASSSASRKRASGSTKPAKPPCKYGARDADGKCPKKPSTGRTTAANRTKVTAKTGDAAVGQAIDVLTNKRATAEQKAQAVQQVGTTVVTDAARRTVKKKKTAIVDAVKKYGGTVLPVAVAVGVGVAAAKQIPKQRQKEAQKFAEKELAKTRKRLGKQKLSSTDARKLYYQYYDYALKKPVENPFINK